MSRFVIKSCGGQREVAQELSTRVLYQGKIFFRNEGKIRTFLDEGIPREFVISRPNFKKWLKKVL